MVERHKSRFEELTWQPNQSAVVDEVRVQLREDGKIFVYRGENRVGELTTAPSSLLDLVGWRMKLVRA